MVDGAVPDLPNVVIAVFASYYDPLPHYGSELVRYCGIVDYTTRGHLHS
jgi:hypothetical protein